MEGVIYHYIFKDGYECWTCGFMDFNEMLWKKEKHGELIKINVEQER